jgi:hypothetical protein
VNTTEKKAKNLKAFLHWCFDKEVCACFPLKHMVVEQVESDKVYLTEDERRNYRHLTIYQLKKRKPVIYF